jgi:hemerythrin-like domain-containing protein
MRRRCHLPPDRAQQGVPLQRTPSSATARQSALAIIEAEHAAFDGALSWILGQLALASAHRIAPDPGIFEQGLAFIATFMERFHHPKEDEFLFKAVRERTRDADEVLATLQQQHAQMPEDFRNLRLALSGARRGSSSQLDDFTQLMERFARAQADHMRLEGGVFATAERVLRLSDWDVIDVAFRANCDPLFGAGRGGLTSILARPASRG